MKLRFTALSISSIDMKTVIRLRRNKNPATPRPNRIALRMRYQESGVGPVKGSGGILIDLLARENDRADDGDQDQDAGDFEGQQVGGEQPRPDGLRPALEERSEAYAAGGRQQYLHHICHQPYEAEQQRGAGPAGPDAALDFLLGAGVQQHDDEDEQHHDGSGVDD